jgi:hypothetical protein
MHRDKEKVLNRIIDKRWKEINNNIHEKKI